MRKRTRALIIILLLPFALTFVALLFFTQTNVGREQVRRLAVSLIDDMIVGEVRIGAVEGNLLRGVVLRDVSIVDTLGRPFIAAERISARYGRRALIGRRIDLTGVRLEGAVIVLDRRPGDDDWNFQRIFPAEEPPLEPEPPRGWGRWVRLDDVLIERSRVIVRTPWEPDANADEAARRRAAEAALAGEGRSRVEQVPEGLQQVMDFRSMDAELPRIVIAEPDREAMVVEVASLQAIAEPFLPPAAVIRDVRGTFRISEDSLWFRDVAIELPQTRVIGSGTYHTETGDLLMRMVGAQVASADMRWIYPRLPAQGGGPVDLTLLSRGEAFDVVAETPGLRLQDARVSGRFGMLVAEDSIQFRTTDLRFADVDTRLLEQLVPDLVLPRRGTLHGRAALDGPINAIAVDADLTFDDVAAGRSRVLAAGEVGIVGEDFRTRNLRVRLDPLQVELARVAMPDLPVSGTLSGTATVSGSTATRMAGTVDLVHRDRGELSALAGRVALEFVEPQRVDLDLRARPLSLVTVGRFVPAVELRGAAAGTIRMTGHLGDAELALDLGLPAGGALQARGRLALDTPEPGYDFWTTVQVLDLASIVQGSPSSSISATIIGRGYGIDPETMRASFALQVEHSEVDGVVFEEVEGRIAFDQGLLVVDTVHVATAFAAASVGGSFGLAPHRSGELRYEIAVDSLAGFERWMPVVDTGVVEPAPRVRARAMEEARRAWVRQMEEAEVERAALRQLQRRQVELDLVERPLPRDTIAGSILARGQATGHTQRFDVRGDATAFDILAMGHALGFGRVEYAVANAPATDATIIVGATLDSVRTAGFAFDTVHVRTVVQNRAGELQLAVIQDVDIEYVTQAEFELRPEENSIRIEDIRMRFDTTVWVAAHPAAIRWGPQGISIDSLDLRSGEDGRLYVHGTLPTEDDLDLEVDIHRFELGHAVALFQREEGARGVVIMTARATGSPANPRLRGAAALVDGSLMDRDVPDVRTSFVYENETLVATAEALSPQRELLAIAEARLPLNLALTEDPGPRLPDRPLEVDIRADSLPLDALPSLTDAIAEVRGQLTGEVQIRGTIEAPELAGNLNVHLGSFMIVRTGVPIQQIHGALRIENETLVIDSLVGWSRGPIRVRGTLGLANPAEPSFDLRLTAGNALLLDTDEGRLRADADVLMRGPWDGVLISGDVTIRSGVYFVPDFDRQVIDLTDPQVLRDIDPLLLAEELEALPEPFPLLDNLRAQLNVTVLRDTWVRSPEANIEIFSVGDLTVEIDMAQDRYDVEGVVNTDRGEYTFLGRRFLISRGSVTFIGDEAINPLLQIVAEHEVRGRDPFEIQVVIGGTLREPNITLESNAQPPISETELLTYIAFGRQTSSLLQLQGASGLDETGRLTGGRVIGLATQQMAAVALGVLVSEAERTAGRTLGAEVINITPGDVPQELARGAGFGEVLQGIEVEVGRYVDTRTFVAVQSRLGGGTPGLRVQHRLPGGYRVETALEPRLRLREPSLAAPTAADVFSVFGLFLIREWRF